MDELLKILILEDSETDAELAQRAMRKDGIQFESKIVDQRDEFIQALTQFHPDVILSDHSLPQFNSLEALKLCIKMDVKAPFILVTGTVSEEFAVNCLKMGADDYVLKSNLARLPNSIRSALKQHELEMRRVKAELDLRKQNEELIRTNQELDSFVYSVSHNLRSPLTSVLGLIHLASGEDKAKGGTLTSYFEMMEKSVVRLDDTLHEILDYSRNARIDIANEPVNLKQLIEESFEKIKYLIGFERVETKIIINEKAPLYSDTYRLSVIFNNIASNAIKYCDIHKDRSYFTLTADIDEKSASFTIKDNGIGIPKELQAKVFNMFFRGNERSDGAGLGLYIVKEKVIKLGGTIEVESELGVGTTFKMELPNHRR